MPKTIDYEYMQNQELLKRINQSPEYRKKERTDLRRVQDTEIGQQHTTYVLEKNTQQLHVETSNTFSKNCVLARNRQPIGLDKDAHPIYNEWLIPVETVIQNYGQEVLDQLMEDFQSYAKKTTIKAVKIDDEFFNLFKQFDCIGEDEVIHLKISWGVMAIRKGDYLTNAGYAISAQDMQGYELVQTALKEKELDSPRFFGERKKEKTIIESLIKEPLQDENPKRLSETTLCLG